MNALGEYLKVKESLLIPAKGLERHREAFAAGEGPAQLSSRHPGPCHHPLSRWRVPLSPPCRPRTPSGTQPPGGDTYVTYRVNPPNSAWRLIVTEVLFNFIFFFFLRTADNYTISDCADNFCSSSAR